MSVYDFTQGAVALAERQDAPVWLSELQQLGLDEFKQKPWPTRKTEAWKYTSLYGLTTADYNQPVTNFTVENAAELASIDGLETQKLVFVNGQFNAELSDDIQQSGLTLVRFSEASDEQQLLIKQHLGKVCKSEKYLFAALNQGLLNDGVFLVAAKGQRIEKPVQLVQLTSAQPQQASVFSRVLVVLEAQAELTLIEHFASTDESQNVIVNQVTEVVVGDSAHLHHYRLHLEQQDIIHVGSMHVDLQRDSQISSFQLAMGSQLKRIDVEVNHNVGGSHCELKGVYLPRLKQHVDFHTNIEHAAANCTTDEVFRGIISDQAKAVFNGRIHIHPDAQKTLAELSNKNLLTSNQAEINTKPELEIYADDVRCAHGATIAQLDEKARFYLQSRGISAKEAQVILSFAFINELLDALPIEAIRNKLRPKLAELFAADEKLVRHIG